MASVHDSIPHTVRTANDPRQTGLCNCQLSHVEQINSQVRLLRLSLPRDGAPFRHLPGQWLDVHIPSLPQAGGFTITSPPHTCLPSNTSSDAYLELAIANTPNPPARFFHKPPSEILQTQLTVRVGGRFVYPPLALSYTECASINKAVFIAGGVGVNPIMSMVSAMHGLGPGKVGGMARQVRLLYATKIEDGDMEGESILFYDRMKEIAEHWEKSQEVDFQLTLFTSSRTAIHLPSSSTILHEHRRMTHVDILEAIGPENDRANTVAYVCGPPAMTDEFVALLQRATGLEQRRVLCEKWW